MSNLIEPTPEEPNGSSSSGPNRTFILIALGLAGLLVVGLLGVFGYVAASRFGLIGTRENPTPVTSPAAATPAGTRPATTPAGGTVAPAAVTSAPGTPRPATVIAVTPVVVGTPAATRVISLATTGATAAATRSPSGAATAAAPAQATPTTVSGGVTAEATATPTGGTGGSQALPQTGAELDLLIIAGLLVLLVVLARSFRAVLRS
ncbi:MAG: hypothetical protein HZB53_07715 [Chloroflexi bacterium]|nr:hypothetical protein [Chloroflexota bacterium]